MAKNELRTIYKKKETSLMAKKVVRLTESELINLVKNTARKMLKEGLSSPDANHVYRDENGGLSSDSGRTWRGVPGTKFIWHGEWADPEILYKNQLINSNDAEDMLYNSYEEEREEGYKGSFDQWVAEQPKGYLAGCLDDILFGMSETETVDESISRSIRRYLR